MKTSRPCRIVSYAPGGRSERKSTVRPPRCIHMLMFANHPQGALRNRAGGLALQNLHVLLMSGRLGECRLPRRGHMKAFRPCRIVSYAPGRVVGTQVDHPAPRYTGGASHTTGARTTKSCLARKGIENFA